MQDGKIVFDICMKGGAFISAYPYICVRGHRLDVGEQKMTVIVLGVFQASLCVRVLW